MNQSEVKGKKAEPVPSAGKVSALVKRLRFEENLSTVSFALTGENIKDEDVPNLSFESELLSPGLICFMCLVYFSFSFVCQ